MFFERRYLWFVQSPEGVQFEGFSVYMALMASKCSPRYRNFLASMAEIDVRQHGSSIVERVRVR
jgi:hypothetical protein